MEKSISSEFKIVEEPKKTLAMNPKKFAMWLFIGSVVMLFASLTSAYIVRQAEGNWLYFELPELVYYSTAIILVSSITMHAAYYAAKSDNISRVNFFLYLTLILGISFLVSQYLALYALADQDIHFVGNPSGSFVIAISFVHFLHIIGGIIFLIIILNSTYKLKIHSKSLSQMEMCITYWHFLGGVWLYLFLFFLFFR